LGGGPRGGLGGPNNAQPADKLGVETSDAPGGGGARVEDVSNDAIRDISPGDVIIEINGAPIKDSASLRKATARLKPGTTALLKVKRGRTTQFAAVPVPTK